MSDNDKDPKEITENLYKIAVDTIDTWVRKHCIDSDDLKNTINKKLDNSVNEILRKILGFRPGYDYWEIDHCNGRSGESAAGDYLKSKAGGLVNEWLDKYAGNLTNFEMDSQTVEVLRTEIKSIYEQKVREELRQRAKDAAKRFVDKLIGEIKLDEDKMKEGIKALEFISLFSKVAAPEKDK